MPTITSPTPLTPAQLAAMDVNQRRAYFSSLPADQQQSQQAAYNIYRNQSNRNYMRTTLRKYAVCPPQSGNALNQPYATATQLTYNVPTAENGFLEEFIIQVSLTVTLAAGTSATYQLNAAAPLNVIQEIDVLYGNIQMRFRPYILRYLKQLLGYNMPFEPGEPVIAGAQHLGVIDNYLMSNSSGTPSYPVAVGANTWKFEVVIPMTILHPQDVRGMLPIMSGETTAQINIITASAFVGFDPILSPIGGGPTGSGGALTSVTGTVAVIAAYRDGVSLMGPARQGLDIIGLPTVQWDIDPPLNNLVSGSVIRQKINKAENLAIGLLTVMDGTGASAGRASTINGFGTIANFAEIELAKDSSGTNKFWQFGLGTNVGVNEYFAEIRRILGQDLDEGIIPFVYAPVWTIPDPQHLDGIMYLNTLPSGWTDVNYGLQVTSIGNGGTAASTLASPGAVNARVECHLIFINPIGLIAG